MKAEQPESTLRVAAAAWKIRPARRVRGDGAYFGHMHDFVSAAHDRGAQVVVLPELHVLELLQVRNDVKERDSARYLAQYADAIEEWMDRISDLSGLVIVGGSHFRDTGDGIFNVCSVGIPGGGTLVAKKNNLTTYEREVWNMREGRGLVRLPFSLGLTICYDVEFPESGRALAEAGMLVHCVPSWTETEWGFRRVRTSCLARALENSVYVVQSSLVGDLGREPVPQSFGSSAILAPMVEPFPASGVIEETEVNAEGLVVADLDLARLAEIRLACDVRNWEDRNAGTWTVAPEPRRADEPPNPLGKLN